MRLDLSRYILRTTFCKQLLNTRARDAYNVQQRRHRWAEALKLLSVQFYLSHVCLSISLSLFL
jgi:hypothetical protein